MKQAFVLRQAVPSDAPGMYRVFAAAIRGLVDGPYNADQRRAWVEYASPQYFGALIAMDQHYLRVVGNDAGRVVAFGALHADEISYLYVRPAAALQGLGSMLLRDMEGYAATQGVTEMRVRSSLTAQQFYAKHGYEVLRDEQYVRGGIAIPLVCMGKPLSGEAT